MTGNLDAADPARIVIRSIDDRAEVRAVEELQKDVWGIPDIEVVPLTQLVAAAEAGGVLLGAFDDEDLIGFVYGFVGLEHGGMTHHSHMLAVKPDYRNFNVGYRLKCAQRDFVLAQGIGEMTWTFDPLQSLNAHFNLNRLGAVSGRYLADFYGTDAASFLHRAGTDRLWVTWPLASGWVSERLDGSTSELKFEDAMPLVEYGEGGEPVRRDPGQNLSGEPAYLEIPADINALVRQSPELAADWREATRAAFTAAFAAGYVAVDFARGSTAGKYLLCEGETLREA
jgi:predicted GNAT superfamily acetyltransferase